MLTTAALATAAAHAGPWAAGYGWLFFLVPLFWFLVIGTLIFFVARGRRRYWAQGPEGYGPPWARGASAEQTLGQRFANGDIDETEYRARLEVLRANRPNA
ncbi:SHOCT domain-containing protein [Agromyces sp. NPDC058136]|uniref:SHOCT domain-containing protein n=1 Tax=Agromyces sp. NPDC058136 TaxID=3346354 RepID=UPI0036D7BFFD